MKLSLVLASVGIAKTALLQLVTAQTIFVYSTGVTDCAKCPTTAFCTNNIDQCVIPTDKGVCFNATIKSFQYGCEDGYECTEGLCECFIDIYVDGSETEAPTAAPETQAPTTSPPTYVATSAPTAVATSSPSTTTTTSSAGIYTLCPSGTYWEIDATACRGPSNDTECYNPATAKYQEGCADGFTCINNKCSTIPPATFAPDVCYVKCSNSNQYCENGKNFCRGPAHKDECFNPATGYYQNGCGYGFTCANNLCVRG